MKKMDKDGLTVCTMQGNVFADSIAGTDCSSEIFMRRFMTSQIVKEFDSMAILDDSIAIQEIFQRIENEFGASGYGKIKYEKEVLFWIGYIYRYFACTYELSSKYVYKLIKPRELNELYYVYHTFDPAVAIERILEEKNISFDADDQNKRLLKLLRKRRYEKEIHLKRMAAEYAHALSAVSTEQAYFKEKTDSYAAKKESQSCILFAIIYLDEVIGEVCFKNHSDDRVELEIVIKDDHYRNKGIGTAAISKAISIAKEELCAKALLVSILKDDERSVHVFKNLGFNYADETDDSAVFEKKL